LGRGVEWKINGGVVKQKKNKIKFNDTPKQQLPAVNSSYNLFLVVLAGNLHQRIFLGILENPPKYPFS